MMQKNHILRRDKSNNAKITDLEGKFIVMGNIIIQSSKMARKLKNGNNIYELYFLWF